jgi:hypothetical protein
LNREIFRVFRVSWRFYRSRDAWGAKQDAEILSQGVEISLLVTGKPTGKEQGASREGNR